ncbi:hypothetical protein BH10BDE1_BH10BDE1_06830 [soil metagenome]
MPNETFSHPVKWYARPLVPSMMFVASFFLLLFAVYVWRGFPAKIDVLDVNDKTDVFILFLILAVSSLVWLFVAQLARLHQSRENLRLTIESSTDLVVLFDRQGRYVEIFSIETAKLIGPAEEILGRHMREVMGQELGLRVENAITEVLASGEKRRVEYSLQLNGHQLWFDAILSKRDSETVVAMVRDVTREHHLATQLEEQRLFMENILNSISDPIFTKNDKHEWLYGNDAFSALLGQPRENYYGKDDRAFFPEELTKVFFESDDRTFASMNESETEESMVEASGGTRTILTKKIPFISGAGKQTLVGIIRDITDRKAMERQLADERARQVAASRLASLGEMAGGVAHEINNPLAIISGYTARLIDVLDSEPFTRDRAREIVRRIDATTTRISTIIKGLRAISRDGGFDSKESVAVENIVSDTLGLCFERFRNAGVKLETTLEPNLMMYCRSVQISQVLLNLLTNAFFAVSKHPNAEIRVRTRKLGEFAEISVTDSGIGVDPELRERIFEPFFTTKPVGMGTGLGLSIASSIVREHDGELFLDPASPATRFVVRVPISKPE